jgi:enediyne polyketide synthase
MSPYIANGIGSRFMAKCQVTRNPTANSRSPMTLTPRGRDPYLEDHRIDGRMVFPGALGLEAMAQVTSVLSRQDRPAVVEAVQFRQAIVVPERGSTRLRIMALAGSDGRIEAVIRSDDDDFATDRMRATFLYGAPESMGHLEPASRSAAEPIDARPLYGSLFFQDGCFRRIASYSHLSARRIVASLLPVHQAWFSSFEPQRVVMGDPGIRDALLHALQVAVPHLRVVPVSVNKILTSQGGPPVTVESVEIAATTDTFVFDIRARDAGGAVVEIWQGATFHAISDIALDSIVAAVPEIAAPYLERVTRSITNDESIEVALISNPDLDRDERRARALVALGLGDRVFARVDGKPIVVGDGPRPRLSIAHCKDITLAVKADAEIGCDIEIVPNGSSLDPASHLPPPAQSLAMKIARSNCEEFSAAATRIWAVHEVIVKQNQPLALLSRSQRYRRTDIVSFETALGRIATVHVPGLAQNVMVAIGTSAGPVGMETTPAL